MVLKSHIKPQFVWEWNQFQLPQGHVPACFEFGLWYKLGNYGLSLSQWSIDRCPNAHLRFYILALLTLNVYRVEVIIQWSRWVFLLRADKWQSSVANTHSLIQNNHMWPHSLVDGVLQVLLQPPDLWVQTHLLVCLQLGTSQKKEKEFSSEHLFNLSWRWKGGLLKVKHQISWHLVIKQTELALPCQFNTYGELFHGGV